MLKVILFEMKIRQKIVQDPQIIDNQQKNQFLIDCQTHTNFKRRYFVHEAYVSM